MIITVIINKDMGFHLKACLHWQTARHHADLSHQRDDFSTAGWTTELTETYFCLLSGKPAQAALFYKRI
jgi:hypothetical protein